MACHGSQGGSRCLHRGIVAGLELLWKFRNFVGVLNLTAHREEVTAAEKGSTSRVDGNDPQTECSVVVLVVSLVLHDSSDNPRNCNLRYKGCMQTISRCHTTQECTMQERSSYLRSLWANNNHNGALPANGPQCWIYQYLVVASCGMVHTHVSNLRVATESDHLSSSRC